MNYYDTIQKIKEAGEATDLLKTITQGEISDTALKRFTLYPLMHIVPAGFQIKGATVVFSFELFIMDLVDMNKKDIQDEAEPFWGIDNTLDVHNQCYIIASLLIDRLARGPEVANIFQAERTPNGTFFIDRFEDAVAGVQLIINIETKSTAVTDGIC